MKPEDIKKYTWIAIAIVTLTLGILITLPQKGRYQLEDGIKFDTATGKIWAIGDGEWKEFGVPSARRTPAPAPEVKESPAVKYNDVPEGWDPESKPAKEYAMRRAQERVFRASQQPR